MQEALWIEYIADSAIVLKYLFWHCAAIHETAGLIDLGVARGKISTRRLYVFKHDSELGNASAHSLFDLIQAHKNKEEPARDFSDYTVTVDDARIPSGVSLQRIAG